MTMDSIDSTRKNLDIFSYNLFERDVSICLGFNVAQISSHAEKELEHDVILEVSQKQNK